MPEGHTIHGIAGALNRAFQGSAPVVTSPQGRFADGAALLNGLVLRDAHAHGKHLFVEFDRERILNVHLGLIGKFSVLARPERVAGQPDHVPVQGQVRVRLLDSAHVADLRGPTVCGVVTPADVDAIVARLGPDPLRPGEDPELAWRRIQRSGRSVAELLMDQSVLSGIGNVYRSEVLFRHRVNPATPGNRVKKATWQAIWADLVDLMPLGLAGQQIFTVAEQVAQARAELADSGVVAGPHERMSYVYRRTGEPCLECGSRVRTKLLAGRNLFWCGRCQRRS